MQRTGAGGQTGLGKAIGTDDEDVRDGRKLAGRDIQRRVIIPHPTISSPHACPSRSHAFRLPLPRQPFPFPVPRPLRMHARPPPSALELDCRSLPQAHVRTLVSSSSRMPSPMTDIRGHPLNPTYAHNVSAMPCMAIAQCHHTLPSSASPPRARTCSFLKCMPSRHSEPSRISL